VSTTRENAPAPTAKSEPARVDTDSHKTMRPADSIPMRRHYEPDAGAMLRALRAILESEAGDDG
jgi:hypothetical protein